MPCHLASPDAPEHIKDGEIVQHESTHSDQQEEAPTERTQTSPQASENTQATQTDTMSRRTYSGTSYIPFTNDEYTYPRHNKPLADWIMYLTNYEAQTGRQHSIAFAKKELEPKCNGLWHVVAYG